MSPDTKDLPVGLRVFSDMGVPEIHHVQIAIPEHGEALARQFYGEILGFSEIPKPENLQKRGGVWFRTGNMDLHLGVDRPFAPATKAHVAYRIDDLVNTKSRLTRAGFPIIDDEPLPGFERFYTLDPFGNRIELLRDRGD